MTPPRGIDEIRQRFGAIVVRDGAIIAPAHWESANMVMVRDLPGWSGGALPRKLYINRGIEAPLRAALAACVALGDGYKIRTLGCFAPRPKRVNGDLSTHSWGIAVDLNADTNPLAPKDGTIPPHDLPDAWAAAFEAQGFAWGGRWKRADFMHMQFATGY